MKKATILVFFTIIFGFANGQRVVDMSVTMTHPTATTVIKAGEPFTVYFSCINNGQDPVKPKDSIIFYLGVNDSVILSTKKIFHSVANITSTNGQAFFVQNLTLAGGGGATKLCAHVIVINRQLPDSTSDISLDPGSNNASCVTLKLSGTGLSKTEHAKQSTSVFPNPAKDYIKIDYIAGNETPTLIEICDMQGRIVKVVDAGLNENGMQSVNVDLKGMANGVYFYKITNGQDISVNRFIIE